MLVHLVDFASSLCGESSRDAGIVCCTAFTYFSLTDNARVLNRTRASFLAEEKKFVVTILR